MVLKNQLTQMRSLSVIKKAEYLVTEGETIRIDAINSVYTRCGADEHTYYIMIEAASDGKFILEYHDQMERDKNYQFIQDLLK